MTVLPLPLVSLGAGLPLGRIGLGRGAISGRAAPPIIGRSSDGRAVQDDAREGRSGVARRDPAFSDEALLAAYVDGDRRAFRVLVDRYRDELLHFLMRFLGSRAAAEDVFQETFLQVHTSAESFDVTRRLKPWLFTIAANKARDYHRKHSKRTTVSLSASIDADEGQRFVDLMHADLPGPDSPVLDAERSRLVKRVMDSMPAHLREILLLSYFQRMAYNQIADALEIPLGTVKSRLHSAVAAFARAWAAARSGEDDTTGPSRKSRDRSRDGRKGGR
jgi:RNA polymerase sigma-70 factor (ECF subfamily)